MPRLRTKLIAFLGLFLAPLPTADAFGPRPNPVQQSAEARLMAEFARFATLTDGTVGIAVRDLGTGETLAYNGDTLFPMASTYKVAVAAKILSLLDAGSLSLEEKLLRLGLLGFGIGLCNWIKGHLKCLRLHQRYFFHERRLGLCTITG